MDKSLKRGLALLACVGMLFCITFSVLCQAAETAGDVNVDQSVNMKDVLALRQYLAGMEELASVPHADANGDGNVNMKDVLTIRRYLAGLEATLATFTTTGTDIAAETTGTETETATTTATETPTTEKTTAPCATDADGDPILTALQGTDHTLGVWWWQANDGMNETTRESYFNFFEKNGVTEIYYYCGGYLGSESSRNGLAVFVEAAMKHGMRVAYLFDSQNVVEANNRSFENAVDKYNTYNQEHPEAPLYAIHCDIEPEWEKMQGYVDNFIVNDVSTARANGICVELDLNINWGASKFLYSGSKTHTYDGEKMPIYEILANNCDTMCMMSYRNVASKLVYGIRDSRKAAVKYNTKIIYGMELGNSGETTVVDFHLFSKEYVYNFVAELEPMLQAEEQPEKGYGYAIHQHRSWKSLRNFEPKEN